MKKIINSPWTAENVKRLHQWWEIDGLTSGQIELEFGQLGYRVTRNAIIGRAHRDKMAAPQSKKDNFKEACRQRAKAANVVKATKINTDFKTVSFINRANHHSRKPMEVRIVMGVKGIPKPDGSKAVLLKHSKDGQCKAIIGYKDNLLENAIYCGEDTPDQVTKGGQRVKSPWCSFHKSVYLVESKR